MKIALTLNGNTLESKVSDNYDTYQYLLVVSLPDMSSDFIKKNELASAKTVAQEIINLNCEGIITGNFHSQEAFDILADACITRYLGVGYTGLEALELMNKRSLPLIRNFEGTDGCSGDHH